MSYCHACSNSWLWITKSLRNKPPKTWLYASVSPERLSNLCWIRVLSEARSQLITLHEGGSGIWAGCLADPRVLLHSLLQEKAETEGIPVSQVFMLRELILVLILKLLWIWRWNDMGTKNLMDKFIPHFTIQSSPYRWYTLETKFLRAVY